jgi:hypothetical protein
MFRNLATILMLKRIQYKPQHTRQRLICAFSEHDSCYGMFRRMQAFYAIKCCARGNDRTSNWYYFRVKGKGTLEQATTAMSRSKVTAILFI